MYDELETRITYLEEALTSTTESLVKALNACTELYEITTRLQTQVGVYYETDPSIEEKINNLMVSNNETLEHIIKIYGQLNK